jgi:hypothetical protein
MRTLSVLGLGVSAYRVTDDAWSAESTSGVRDPGGMSVWRIFGRAVLYVFGECWRVALGRAVDRPVCAAVTEFRQGWRGVGRAPN